MTTKSRRPTPTQAETIRVLSEHGGMIERWKGGFWTYPGCKVRCILDGDRVPSWSAGTQTVDAMVKRGWLERCHKHTEAFRDDYRLTLAGYEAAGIKPPIESDTYGHPCPECPKRGRPEANKVDSDYGVCCLCLGDQGREAMAAPEEDRERWASMAEEPRYPR